VHSHRGNRYLPNVPPGEEEQYLVMAVVFGTAQQVIEQMQVHVPQVVEDTGFQNVFWFTTPARAAAFGGVSQAVSSFTGGVTAAVAAATPRSSSSGGGAASPAEVAAEVAGRTEASAPQPWD
jgi:uncharacterized membrane protein